MGVLEKIDISVERTKENILAIQMNINEEKNKEEMVITRIKQPEK
jgi:FtsZ-binding cell division protein ZapB